jgi:ribosomal protein L27
MICEFRTVFRSDQVAFASYGFVIGGKILVRSRMKKHAPPLNIGKVNNETP